MCGRYTYYSSAELINELGLIVNDDPQTALALGLHDNYNVSPGNEMPIIIRGTQKHLIRFMTWGLVPAWSKEPHTSLKLINARKEGLLDKPMWKRLVASRRCVVPARGFYEWKLVDGRKQPYYITPLSGDFFCFAGLWDQWQDQKGNTLMTYTIVTTEPNNEMSKIHNRMPALLSEKEIEIWLGPTELARSQLDDLLAPSSDNTLNIVAVSTDVNNARNNSKELIYPLQNNNIDNKTDLR